MQTPYPKPALGAIALAVTLAWPVVSEARVTNVIVDTIESPLCTARNAARECIATDPNYEAITGRAFGALDPMDEHNALITDLATAPRVDGKAQYVASFFVVKPIDMSKSSGLLWHDVPNRGGRITITSDLRTQGDVGVSSGWQGDNAGATAVPADASSPTPVKSPSSNEWVKTPVLSGVTGQIFGRIVNRSGLNAAPLNVMGNPIPYFPANAADNSGATLKVHLKETVNGIVTEGETIPNADWKFCGGGTFAAPLPVTTLPVQVCMRNGFEGD